MSTQTIADIPPAYHSSSSSIWSSTYDLSERHLDEQVPRYPDAPRYSAVFAQHGRPIQGGRSSRPLTTEHTYNIQNAGVPWVKLKCMSRASSSSKAPRYESGDHIAGSLTLDLASSTHITEITLSVKGSINLAGNEPESHTFLHKTRTLWSKAFGNPRHASSTQNIKHRGNLDAGEYIWPFSFAFPTTFDYAVNFGSARTKSYTTPESFSERDMPATIQYELLLHIGRGSLRPDKSITVPIIYTPKIVPDPPSELRQLSYTQATPLVGPLGDPNGWTTLPSANVQAKLIEGQEPAEVRCQLSLADPLCYARGSVIPFFLDLQSSDSAALDALSDTEAIKVTLQRRVKYYQYGVRGKQTTQTSAVQNAVWWPSFTDRTSVDPDTRTMEGEIHLPRSLQSTSDFPFFSVEYKIIFSAFRSPVIDPEDGTKIPIATQPITVGTFSARGPRTREYAVRTQTQDVNVPRLA